MEPHFSWLCSGRMRRNRHELECRKSQFDTREKRFALRVVKHWSRLLTENVAQNLAGQSAEQPAPAGSVLKRNFNPWRSLPTCVFLWSWDITYGETGQKYIFLQYFSKFLIMENFYET